MFGKHTQTVFPKLTDMSAEITSPATSRYNCIAWAVGENSRFWWPDQAHVGYWPPDAKREETKEAFMQAFRTLGFIVCKNGELKMGIEKIALFGTGAAGSEKPTHAARQLECGKWTSKLGSSVDIIHADVEDVSGPLYGKVICYMSRVRARYRTRLERKA